jgi:hypothetical protein
VIRPSAESFHRYGILASAPRNYLDIVDRACALVHLGQQERALRNEVVEKWRQVRAARFDFSLSFTE